MLGCASQELDSRSGIHSAQAGCKRRCAESSIQYCELAQSERPSAQAIRQRDARSEVGAEEAGALANAVQEHNGAAVRAELQQHGGKDLLSLLVDLSCSEVTRRWTRQGCIAVGKPQLT